MGTVHTGWPGGWRRSISAVERAVQEACRAAIGAGSSARPTIAPRAGWRWRWPSACVSGPGPLGARGRAGGRRRRPRGDRRCSARGRRAIVVCGARRSRAREFERLMAESAVPWRWIGRVGRRSAAASDAGRRAAGGPGAGPRSSTRGGAALSDMSAEADGHRARRQVPRRVRALRRSGIMPRPPTSPTSASTRSSTAGQESAGIAATDGTPSMSRRRWAGSPTSSAASASSACPAIARSVTCATPPRAARTCATPSRSPRHRARADRHRPQRQPRQRRGAPRGARAGRRGLPVLLGHRGHPAPAGPRRGRDARRISSPGRWPGSRAPTPCSCSRRTRIDRRARSLRLPPADPRPSWATPGCSPRRRARSTSWRPSCATSSRARSSSSTTRADVAQALPAGERLQCVFEYVYFARPDSVLWGRNVHAVRKALGAPAGPRASGRWPTSSSPVPDSASAPRSATPRNRACRSSSGLDPQPLRGPHVHRAAAGHPPLRGQGEAQPEPRGARRQAGGRRRRLDRPRHHQPQDREDDPRAPARARSTCASPRRRSSGPATTASTRPTRKELIGSSHNVEEIQRYLGADSLGYLSLDGMLKATGSRSGSFLPRVLHGPVQGRVRVRGTAAQLQACSTRKPTSATALTYRPPAWTSSRRRGGAPDRPSGRATLRPEVLGGIGAFAAFCRVPSGYRSRCSSPPPTGWAPSSRSR